ncbi:unnamed protein product [Mytilus edulis]|uniref:Uncharacterized protein n=1 Tax=Mytilus edulis TaxID=6550 RepID=A0A8S3TDD3_MYTED|nr:unnamed protein product [Mytilus edulis]
MHNETYEDALTMLPFLVLVRVTLWQDNSFAVFIERSTEMDQHYSRCFISFLNKQIPGTSTRSRGGSNLLLDGLTWDKDSLPPVSETLLMRFVAYCAEHKQLCHSTIKLYLCGIRCGEFTVMNQFDPECNLCCSDLQITADCIFVTLKKSKTDPFRQGITIPLYKTGCSICPVLSILKYNQLMQSGNTEAFFISEDMKPLNRKFFISHVILGLSCYSYNGHSFRIGAATSAQEARLEDHLIQTLGRWSSNCYTRYIHTSPNVLKNAQKQLSETDRS